MSLEPTERGRILSMISNEIMMARVGRVTNVKAHAEPSDNRNHEVNVEWPPSNPEKEYRDVAIKQPADGIAYVPEKNDMVLLQFLDGDADRPIVTGYVYASDDSDRAPVGEPGDRRIRTLGNAELEITENANSETIVRISPKGDATSTPSSGIQFNIDNGSFKIVDDSGMGIASDGNGNIELRGNSIATSTDGTTIDFP